MSLCSASVRSANAVIVQEQCQIEKFIDDQFQLEEKSIILIDEKQAIEGTPDGLQYLETIDYISLLKNLNVTPIIDCRTKNIYEIVNCCKQRMYIVGEIEPNCLDYYWSGGNRPLRLQIADRDGNICLEIERKSNCCICYFGIFYFGGNKLHVWAGTKYLGQVVPCCGGRRKFEIKDDEGEVLFILKGTPGCLLCLSEYHVNIYTKSDLKDPIGLMKKQFLSESPSKSSTSFPGYKFEMQFPHDLTPSMKALLIAAIIQNDCMVTDGDGMGLRAFWLLFLPICVILIVIFTLLTIYT